jgi:acyl transferase domain-containing protein
MSDEQSRRTDAIQAAYNEAHAQFMKAHLIIAELLPELTLEELTEYQRIDGEIAAFHTEQNHQQQTLIEIGRKASTGEEKFEYAGHLLAVVEKNTERLHQLTEELADLVRSHLTKKEP